MIKMIDVENAVYEKQLHCQGLAGDSGPCSFAVKYEDDRDCFACTHAGCIITEQHVKRIEGEVDKTSDLLNYCILQFPEQKVGVGGFTLYSPYEELCDYILMVLGKTEFNTEGDGDLKDMIITKMVELAVEREIKEYEDSVNER